MKLIRNSLASGIAFVALTVAACSSQHGATGTGSSNGGDPIGSNPGTPGNFGTVGLHLDIGTPPNGASVTALNWTISNGTNTYTGTTTVGDAQSFEFVQGGIVAGSGYTVTLSGTDNHGDPCTGVSSAFTIVAGAVTQTTLAVICTAPTDASTAADVRTGTVEVDASVTLVGTAATNCPGIQSFSISPAEIAPGQSAALTLLSVGPAAAVTWSVSPAGGGSFGSTSAANTTFLCAAPTSAGFVPQVTVTATVGLLDSGACTGQVFTTQSALVNCEGVAVPVEAGPQPEAGPAPEPQPEAGPAPEPQPEAAPPPPSCVAECPSSNAACTNGETQGIGFPGCNQTEALFNTHSTACLQCVLNAGCLHDTAGDQPPGSIDCEDVTGTNTVSGGTRAQSCFDLLTCELPSDCGAGNVLDCYCGLNVNSTTCKTTQTGACIPQVQTGLESTDPNFIQANFSSTGTGLGGAAASKLLLCAHNNCDPTCF